jgi:hypothetical protein
MGTGPESHVLPPEGSQLGDAQPGLEADEEECVIAASDPSGEVWGAEEGIDLTVLKELHDPTLEALARNGKDTLTEERVGWIGEGDEAEEGMKRREAGIATAGAVTALTLEVIEELAEEGGVEVGEPEAGGRTARPFGRESEE